MTEHGEERTEKETGRVEAFSDGVFAIAITLLILEIKVPHGGDLARQLLDEWPSYLAFLTSFGTIGIMWLNHHRLFTLIHRIDHGLMVWNGLLLLGVTFVPFPTAVLAEHLGHADEKVAAAFYAGTFFVIAIFFNGLWRWAISPQRRPRLTRVPVDAAPILAIRRQYNLGPIFYLAALLLAPWSAAVSFGLCIALALFFALPPRVPD